jgi:hypothetical protein
VIMFNPQAPGTEKFQQTANVLWGCLRYIHST